MAGFYKSDPLVFYGWVRDGAGVDEKLARHMEQGFQPILTGFVDCISLRASACSGAIDNTAFAHSWRV